MKRFFLKISNMCRENILIQITILYTDILLLQRGRQFFLGKISVLSRNKLSDIFRGFTQHLLVNTGNAPRNRIQLYSSFFQFIFLPF